MKNKLEGGRQRGGGRCGKIAFEEPYLYITGFTHFCSVKNDSRITEAKFEYLDHWDGIKNATVTN